MSERKLSAPRLSADTTTAREHNTKRLSDSNSGSALSACEPLSRATRAAPTSITTIRRIRSVVFSVATATAGSDRSVTALISSIEPSNIWRGRGDDRRVRRGGGGSPSHLYGLRDLGGADGRP